MLGLPSFLNKTHLARGISAGLLILSLTASIPAQAFLWWGKSPEVTEVSLAGETRSAAKLYLPDIHDSAARPLVILLHGYSATPARTAKYFGLDSIVARRGFYLLVPEGTRNSRGETFWNATDFCCDNERSGINDLGYLLRLIREVRAKYAVDPARVYLVGHSNGGFMTNRLLCEAPELFAAAATLAGGTFRTIDECTHAQPIPYLQIHAVDDPTIRFDHQENYAGGSDTLAQRRKMNRCAERSTESEPLDLVEPIHGLDTQVTNWTDCAPNADVSLWLIQPYKGHPGSAHKPALQSTFSDHLVEWLFAHRK